MARPAEISSVATDVTDLATRGGRIAMLINENARPLPGLPRAAREAVLRALESDAWKKVKPGGALELSFPAGMAADALQLVALPRRASVDEAREAGAAIGAKLGKTDVTVLSYRHVRLADVALGLALRAYDFDVYKSRGEGDGEGEGAGDAEAASEPAKTSGKSRGKSRSAAAAADESTGEPPRGRVTFTSDDPEALARAAALGAAVAEGVFFTRDLISEPANVLTTSDFADRLLAMRELGLEVEVLDEDELAKLGMRALLAVGQGSESPSKVVVMRWNGGEGDEAPLALVGKGVVFDTGGISIKPGAGMEEMTMDMGGAGVVAGVMRTLALRRAKANVVGLVGLVENMPDGRAYRPGDIVKSMKGDTIEIINTDAEGRLVLADVLWYAQERFALKAVIDLATLTGAIIIALGHDHAGIFANDDALADSLLKAAKAEGEGAWRLPLGPSYDGLIESRLADMKNTGGRSAGSITAAQFLQRFVRKGQPWVHIDIAGVAMPPSATKLAPKGATGWGVMTLDRLVRDHE
ncbi:leucyl aminopeptidase [Paracoccus sp. DMF-8]|uniref:leucyl aminopeptidase n=1 Tax=Paracoccus sp. DMF-8 TaxID=3019445 RepID=UPI0023E8CEA0|nr:leucyl aminopeptidase [Paracoccus sp. DMF-8]MDF3605912.1 leucyl aminopeptidase [Paracoccus sp. DMF-8]